MKRRVGRARVGRGNAEMNCQDSCKDLEIQLSFLWKAIQKMSCGWEALDCQKRKVWHLLPPPLSFLFLVFLS